MIFSHGIKLGAGEPGNVGMLSEIVSVRSKIFIITNKPSV